MSTYILASMFPNGFPVEIAKSLQQIITKRNAFAFVASEFEKMQEVTDEYFAYFINMFHEQGIHFEKEYVVDGRITFKQAQEAVEKADVIWLSGGNTPVEFKYLKKYGLDKVIKQHQGVIIGLSAGAINMAETAICTLSCQHEKQEVYSGLGCVDISVEPHFVRNQITDEVINLSKNYTMYGLCDNGMIVCKDNKKYFFGEVYKIENGKVERIGK